jgi:hypothetical protein
VLGFLIFIVRQKACLARAGRKRPLNILSSILPLHAFVPESVGGYPESANEKRDLLFLALDKVCGHA